MSKFPIALVLILTIISGCGGSEDNSTREEQINLATNKAIWKSRNIESYQFTASESCFCPHEEDIVTMVANGEIVSAFFTPSGENLSQERMENLLDIDDYFDLIQRYFDSGAYRIDVDYDSTTGIPMKIDVDIIELGVDDEIFYRIYDFQ